MLAGSLELQISADMSRLAQDFQNAQRFTDTSMSSMAASMAQVQKSIDAIAAAEAARASIFSRTMGETKRLLNITKGAAEETAKSLAELRIDPNALIIPDEAIQSLKTWQEKAAYAIGVGAAVGWEKAKTAWEEFKGWMEKSVVIWGAALATGVAAVVFTAIYAAYKSIGFAIGLLTGESYKSANIDALVKASDELTKKQNELATALANSGSAIRDNQGSLIALGVEYKGVNGEALTTVDVLKNAIDELDKYTEGTARNAAAVALGLGSYEEISKALKSSAGESAEARARLNEYNLGIGTETQTAVEAYKTAMDEFNAESKKTADGFSRAWADQIMPALTDFAVFFKDGFPFAVNAFRYSMATITSLFYGLKTVVYMVTESIVGSISAIGSALSGVAGAAGKALTGDFSGAKDSLIAGWTEAKSRLGLIGDNIIAQSRHSGDAMRLAWAFDGRDAAAGQKVIAEGLSGTTAQALKAAQAYNSSTAGLTKLQQDFVSIGAAMDDLAAHGQKDSPQFVALQDALMKVGKLIGEVKPAAGAGEAIDKQVKAYSDLIAKIGEKITSNLLEAKTGKALTESQALQIEIDKLVTTGKIKAADASSELTKKLLLELDASEKAKALALEVVKANLAQAEAHGKYVQSLADGVTKLDEQVRQQRDATAEIGLTKDAIGELRAAEIDRQAATVEGFAIRQFEHNLGEAEYNLALANVKALRELANAKRAFGTRETAYAAEQEQAKEQLRLINSIDTTAQSVWTNVFEGGSNAFKKLGQTLKAALLDMLYQMTIRKWVINIAGVVTGAGASTMAQAAGAGNSIGGIGNLLSGGNSLMTAITGGGLGTTASGLIGSGTSALFGGVAGNAALGGALGLGAGSSTAAALAAAEAGGATITAGAAGLASSAAGLGAAFATAIPYIGLAVLAISLLSKKGIASSSTGSMERTYDENNAIVTSSSVGGRPEGNAGSVIESMQASLQALKTGLGATGGSAFGYGAYTGNDNKNPMFRITGGGFNSGETAQTEASLALAASRAVFSALSQSQLPKELAGLFNGLDPAAMSQEQITKVYEYGAALKSLNANVQNMPFENIKNLSYEAMKGLIDFSGGLPALTTNLGTFYTEFYSVQEKAQKTASDIATRLQSAGATGVTAESVAGMTREQFRAMVEAQDVTTTSGQALYAALLSVSGAFAGLVPATTAAAASIVTISDTMKTLQKDRASLQADVMQARGDTGGADTVRRALAVATYTDAETKAYDYNQALRQEIKTRQDATAAAISLAATNKGLADQLAVMKGTETDRSIALRDATDNTTRELLRQIYAQQDLKTATQEAAVAATQAAAAQKAAAVAAMQAATTAVNAAFNQVTAAANDQKAALSATFQSLTNDINAQLSTVGASIGKLQSLSSALSSTLSNLQVSGGQNAARVDAQSTIAAMLETAKSGGGLPVNTQALNSALSTLSKPSEQLFGSFVDYAKDFYKASNNISALNDLTTKGLTSEQIVEATLKSQLAIEKASYDSQITQITAVQNQAKAQLDAFNGNTTVLTTLKDALALFTKTLADAVALNASQIVGAIVVLPPQIASAVAVLSASDRTAAVQSASTKATQNGTDYELELYNKAKALGYSAADADKALGLAPGATAGYIARTGLTPLSATSAGATAGSLAPAYVSAVAVLSAVDRESVVSTALKNATQNGTDYQLELYKYAKSIGYKAEDVDRALGLAAGATKGYISSAGLTQLAVGTNYVPQDMVAQIHEGEAVVPKAFNPAANGGSNADLATELRAMRKDFKDGMAAMQTSQERGNEYAKTSSDRLSGRQGVPMLVQIVSKTGALA